MSKRQEKYKEAFAVLAAKMDKREAFYKDLEVFVTANGAVPEQYKEDWRIWTEVEMRKPWRAQPLVVMRIQKAAKLLSRQK